jgi:hypothetical protein
MTFFYDLNKRMADLSQKQTLSEGAVAERATGDYSAKKAAAGKDIGKPGKNFEKIAKSAGQRYGSKAAGERVAGAVLNKLRGKNESQLDELSPDTIASYQKKAYPQATTTGPKSDQRTAGIVRSLGRPTNEGDMDESALQGYLGKKKYGPEGMKALQKAGRDHASKDQMNKIRNQYDKMDEAELDEISRGEYIKQQDTNAEKSGKQKFNAFGQTFDTDEIDEGGLPMTTVNGKKVPKFAADGQGANDLAKKKSFNDKIAGAKQEVEEMLGDVAAEAMRNALGKKQMADEGFDDMERDVKRRLSTPKVGDVRRGARHDIETTATGVRATRRQDDETDDQPTGEKRRAGRPKGADKGPERVTGKAYKHKGGRVKEGNMSDMIEPYDADEYDSEGDMAKEQLHTMKLAAMELSSILSDDENLPEWVQSKITKALDYVDTARDYMISTKADRGMAVDEEKTSTRDNRAERAGKKVAKDIEYDEKKKDGIHGKKRGAEDSKAERAGKTVAKDIEYDEKKKEKKVDETTTSGSVATGGDAPKATKGGMQVGKGIYDSMNREVENMIAESMSINVSMSSDDNGSHKNITVTAADEDAEALAQLLRSAGLGGDMSPDHGMAEAYGDVTATENKPDYPTDTEYSDDAMQYSGGLNGPKSTGQTTIPVIAHQGARTGIDDEELRRMMEMAGIQQDLKPWERTMKEEEAVEEGVVDKVKDAVKKGLEKLGHGSDEDMRKDLQKKIGVPPTGEKPADKKMEESLMKEFANFKI